MKELTKMIQTQKNRRTNKSCRYNHTNKRTDYMKNKLSLLYF